MKSLNYKVKKVYQFIIDRPFPSKTKLANQYEVVEILGQGSYGITYLCNDLYKKKLCVVKQMRRSKKKDIKHMYKEEISMLRMLKHSSIPKLFHTFSYQKQQFIVMEYIKGKNLEDVIFSYNKQFSELDALLFIKELTKSVSYLHQNGITHGDIRIPNVILHNDKIYLIDFGLAQIFNQVQPNDKKMLVQDDFYDLGDFLLFLLYTSYDSKSKKNQPWTEELTIQPPTVDILNKLLSIKEPYQNCSEVMTDIDSAVVALSNSH